MLDSWNAVRCYRQLQNAPLYRQVMVAAVHDDKYDRAPIVALKNQPRRLSF